MSNGRLMRILIACCALAATGLNFAYLLGGLPRSVTSSGALLILLCWAIVVIHKRSAKQVSSTSSDGENHKKDTDQRDRVQNEPFDRVIGGIAAAAFCAWMITLGLTMFHG